MITVLTIGYGKNTFDAANSERVRLAACARRVKALHMVIFTRMQDGVEDVRDGNLYLYPTNARTRFGMLIRAYRSGAEILRNRNDGPWLISTQDPFETGLVGYLLHLRYGVPLQVQEHGDFFGTPWWRKETMLNRVRYLFGVWLVRRASCVRTVSKRAREHLESIGVSRPRVSVLSVATDINLFMQKESVSANEDLRAKYPQENLFVLGVGRLVRQKRFDLLIKAFAGMKHPSARLVIIGSGPEEMRLKDIAHSHDVSDRVSFIPWTNHLSVYLQQADIFVLSSAYEGWARIILEAMASGIPSVVTEVGCVGEVFLDAAHGRVVPVGDGDALTAALRELAENPSLRAKYGAAAQEAVRAYADHQKPYAEAWAELMERCGTTGRV